MPYTAFFVMPDVKIAAFGVNHPEIGATTLSSRSRLMLHGRLAHELDLGMA